ncbi:MAG: carboxymuconolactone decarboxylase family protein [Spirochaetota bacterium]|nr:MAG: carboxymuconolactone decarboxylase family protein [Spirochaetota bacterium]
MENLTKKEKELVAIGAALGSNCIPCIIYHIKESKRLGITIEQIKDAVAIADKVKKVPADKVLAAAHSQLKENIEL